MKPPTKPPAVSGDCLHQTEKRWSIASKIIAVVATAVVWATSVLTVAVWAAGDRSKAFHSIGDTTKRVDRVEIRQEAQELRLRSIETSTTRIEANVEWIRKTMEKRPP